MKNIFILPTDKPSRLYYHDNMKELVLTNKIISRNLDGISNQYICIISDEEPKLDEWGINLKNNVVFKHKGFSSTKETKIYEKKIILTTDPKLIKDNIQIIDDEFLEWFVKNPSCEEVEVETISTWWSEKGVKYHYKITIPKEEPKQETLEEAAYRISDEILDNFNGDFKDSVYAGVKLGAKWCSKKSYSEEEVVNIVQKLMYDVHCGDICEGDKLIDFKISPKQWFEQFKKK